jgi:hypothetical protein
MSLDFYLEVAGAALFGRNITHNLRAMACEAGVYKALWRPEEIDATKAADIVDQLRAGLELLTADPTRFVPFNAANGWGTYEHFVSFVRACLEACETHPTATLRVSR